MNNLRKTILLAVGLLLSALLAGCGNPPEIGRTTAISGKTVPVLSESVKGNPAEISEAAATIPNREALYPVKKSDSNPELRKLSGKQISISTSHGMFIVDLYDNSAANDLLTKLPLSFDVSDYSWPEKLLYLKSKDALSMKDYTGGDEPWIPELGYYRPGNWIAMYFGYIGYWPGKIPLGRIRATCEEIRNIPAKTMVVVDIYGQTRTN